MVAGVCGGLAEHFDVDPLLVRLIFVLLAFTPGGIPLYLVLWIVMPAPGGAPVRAPADVGAGVRRMGVELRQAGESAWTAFSGPDVKPPEAGAGSDPAGGVPPAGGGPSGPGEPPPGGPYWGPGGGIYPRWRARRRGVTGGVILVALGVYFLLSNLGLLDWWQWGVAWPLVLIAIGLLILVQRLR